MQSSDPGGTGEYFADVSSHQMCILGRSFALRKMRSLDKSVILVHDMTDAMYNPTGFPYVSDFAGTRLGIAHIETYLCPTIESADLTGGLPFRFPGDIE
jgi:hypothetical protein